MTIRNQRIVLGVALLLVAGIGAGAAVNRSGRQDEEPAARPSESTPVRTAPAELVESIDRERIYTGTLVARRRSVLSFERAGKLIEVLVDEGDHVEQDQLLARLDTRRLMAKKSRAEADLAQAKSVLDELIAGPRTQTIAAAEAEVRSLAAQRDVAERHLRRREQLVKTNAISREEYDESLFDFRAAAARTDVAQKALDELLAGTRQEQVEAQRAQVSALEAALADIYHEIDDATLLAPYAGQIGRRNADEGAVVSAGAEVLTLVERDAVEAWVGLPPASASLLKPGAETEVTIATRSYRAVVQSLRPELDELTRTRNVVLRLAAPEGLVVGQVVRLGVREPVATSGFWVPTAALSPAGRGLWSVLVVEPNDLAATRPVEVIENDGDRSFVRGALEPGEQVIVEGAHRVVTGQRVDARPAANAGE